MAINSLVAGLLTKNLDPETAKLLDQQLQQEQRQQQLQPTQYGGRFGGLLTATSGAIKSAQMAGQDIGGALMGDTPKQGALEQKAIAEKQKQMQQRQKQTAEAARLINQRLSTQLKDAPPEQAKQLKQDAANLIRGVARGDVDANKLVNAMLTQQPKERKANTQVITNKNTGEVVLYDKDTQQVVDTIFQGKDTNLQGDRFKHYDYNDSENKPLRATYNSIMSSDNKKFEGVRKDITALQSVVVDRSWYNPSKWFGSDTVKELGDENFQKQIELTVLQTAHNIQKNSKEPMTATQAIEKAVQFVKNNQNPFAVTNQSTVPTGITLSGSLNK
jgi:hypothetical protein